MVAALVIGLVLAGRAAVGQSISADQTVFRLSGYVEQYYTRAQSIVTNESVIVQRLHRDMSFDGFARRLVYELRVEWDPSVNADESPAKVTRQLLTVNGRPPKKGDKPECMDPKNVSPEPLAFLLPDRRYKYSFTSAGVGRVDGREAVMVDYRALERGEPMVEWTEDCVSVDAPGRFRGRLWAEPETATIVRMDEQLIGMVDLPIPRKHQRINGSLFMTLERADMSIRYRPVRFSDPDETLMLPAEITSSSMWRNGGSAGSRVTQSFSNYRRFVTAGRILR
ncbi:MAG TPA: hypothetical protein VKA59_21315 [Vicinamibacterales bacterium]|nr:hypothetical protein [Vicinamibacterales bacterium]